MLPGGREADLLGEVSSRKSLEIRSGLKHRPRNPREDTGLCSEILAPQNKANEVAGWSNLGSSLVVWHRCVLVGFLVHVCVCAQGLVLLWGLLRRLYTIKKKITALGREISDLS